LWKEFMIDEGLETMNIGFLRGPVVQITQSIRQLALPTNQEGLGPRAGGGSGSEID